MRTRIQGATIAHNGEVSVEGTGPDGAPFKHVTRDRRGTFDWATLPLKLRVIDLEGADIRTVWRTLLSRDFPSFGAKLAAARRAGLKVTTVRRLRAVPRP